MENLNSHLRDRYKRLEDRALWLRQLILNEKNNVKRHQLYKMQLSAIEWAMRVVLKYYTEHPGEDDNLKPCEECANGVNPADGSMCLVCQGKGEVVIPPRIRKV